MHGLTAWIMLTAWYATESIHSQTKWLCSCVSSHMCMSVVCWSLNFDHLAAVQPTRAALCTFWLAALIRGLQEAKHASEAILPAAVLAGYVWLYTGAAVPHHLQLKLVKATVNACKWLSPTDEDLGRPEGQERGAHMSTPEILSTFSCKLLRDFVLTDLQFRENYGECRAMYNEENASLFDNDCPESGFMVQSATNMLLEYLYNHSMCTTPHGCRPDDAIARIMVTLRGSGLCASPYGIFCAPEATRNILQRWLNQGEDPRNPASGIQSLVEGRHASVTLRMQDIRTTPPVSSMPGGEHAAYMASLAARAPAGQLYAPLQWLNAFVLPYSVGEPGSPWQMPRMRDIFAALVAKRAPHLPTMLDAICADHLLDIGMLPRMAGTDAALPRAYKDVHGWSADSLPSALAQRHIDSENDLRAAQIEHVQHVIEEQGGSVKQALQVLLQHRQTPLRPVCVPVSA